MGKLKKTVYVSWHSFNGGLPVLLATLLALHRDYELMMERVVYLHNEQLNPLAAAEFRLLQGASLEEEEKSFPDEKDRLRLQKTSQLTEEIHTVYSGKLYGIIDRYQLNLENVTDYQSIYNEVRSLFLQKGFIEDRVFHINISPGTPQMHTVWLMLNIAGYLPPQTMLWSSQWDKKKKEHRLEKIDFKPKTYIHQVLESTYQGDKPVVFNPNNTRSVERQKAEELISLFGQFPQEPMLILGERGSGKTTYVEALIHKQAFKNLPFEKRVCGIFSEELMRSELFGHEKGSFTGANREKEGVLDIFKEGGVLFLDEVHDLSKPLQRQLMEVLESGMYQPIGGKTKKAVFKLVAASNLSYQELKEVLDKDFLDRISRFVAEVPPLRNCAEDIQEYWYQTWSNTAVLNLQELSAPFWNKDIQQFLESHALPGNFRDLKKLVANCKAFYLKVKDRQQAWNLAIAEFVKWGDTPSTGYFQEGKDYDEIVSDFNFDLATWAKNTYGDMDNAAKALKRSKSSLYKDLDKARIKKKWIDIEQ